VVPITKSRLRAEALAARSLITYDAARRAAVLAARHAMDLLDGLKHAPAIALYSPVRGELDCVPLAETLRQAGTQVLLPVVNAPDEAMVFRHWNLNLPLVRGFANIAQPCDKAEEALPDVVFVPFAAFDARGYRIGYGKGFYDRTLPVLRAYKTVRAFGFGFAVQQVAHVPDEPHDVRLDGMVTENGFLKCKG
jgi:5-formyltetrahydrofolate cyclo-ligase